MAAASADDGMVDISSSEAGNSSKLTVQEKICSAVALKDEGNEFFKKQQYRDAMKKYHRAILHVKGLGDKLSLIDELFAAQGSENISEEEKDSIDEILCSCCNNLAACLMKQKRWDKVCDYSSQVLKKQPRNAKALFRRGQAFYHVKNFDKAEEDLKEAEKLEPNDKGIKKFVRLVEDEQSKGRKKQTAMEKKMFSGMFDKLSMDDD